MAWGPGVGGSFSKVMRRATAGPLRSNPDPSGSPPPLGGYLLAGYIRNPTEPRAHRVLPPLAARHHRADLGPAILAAHLGGGAHVIGVEHQHNRTHVVARLEDRHCARQHGHAPDRAQL